MMRLVLEHGPKPFPESDRRACRCRDPLLIPLHAQRRENLPRFAVQLIVVGSDLDQPVGKLASVPRISVWMPQCRFGVHVAFDAGEVAEHVAERESSLAGRPLEIRFRDAVDDAHRALVHPCVIVEKHLRVADFHPTESRR